MGAEAWVSQRGATGGLRSLNYKMTGVLRTTTSACSRGFMFSWLSMTNYTLTTGHGD
jgi:hypothetical protein